MTYNEQRQQIRNEAMNNIRKVYNPKCQFQYDEYDHSSAAEQREFHISCIISDMEYKLMELSKHLRESLEKV